MFGEEKLAYVFFSNYSLVKRLKINKAMLAMAFLLCSFTQAEVNKS